MLQLLPREDLIKTGPVDFAEWNSRPLLGWIMRQRFRIVSSLLPGKVGRLLEIGFGSGVFMPELANRAMSLLGVDVHPYSDAVMAKLRKVGVDAELHCASAEHLPFEDGSVDAIVAVSSLEFIPDLPAAVSEFIRVLAPDGVIVAVTPAHSPIADAGLRVLAGRRAEDDFEGRRQQVVPTLLSRLAVERRLSWPLQPLPLYTGLRLRPAVAKAAPADFIVADGQRPGRVMPRKDIAA